MAKIKINKDTLNIEEILEINDYLKNYRIDCFKYNTSLDDCVQNVCSFEAFIEVNANSKQINIFNKKPLENVEYALESDPEVLKKA
jgi:hypothetical protein